MTSDSDIESYLEQMMTDDISIALEVEDTDGSNMDVWIRHQLLEEYLAHFGVIGMKWGVRNSESKARIKRAKNEDSSSEPRKKNNSLRSNPKNRRMTDVELERTNKRLRLEREFAQLTYIPKPAASESRVKNMLKDVAFDVTKGALTTVGREILTKALKVQFNKVAAPDFKIDVKTAKKAADAASGLLEIAK